MTDTFDHLKQLIEAGKWGKRLPNNSSFKEPCHQRLFNALKTVETDNEPTPLELVGLIRHFLRREDEDINGGTPQTLKVPRYYPYPNDKPIWERCGMGILQENDDNFLIYATPWYPNWLNFSESPEKDAFAEVKRRNYSYKTPVLGDISTRSPKQPNIDSGQHFLSLVGLTHYRSIGQEEAIKAVLTAPEKATVVINLPTGAGKSLCAQLPALLASKQGGVSVIVVPTTALALDQERALSAYISHPTAYYGDTSEAGKQRSREISQRISKGTQRIVFTSPESLISSLSSCLYDAAKQGYLRYLVIDEVHMVEQWGEEFRPAFQEIPGLRQDLLRYTSFKTVLLTATLTESCLDTLETLFGEPGDFQTLSAVQLRPEPSYWFSRCNSERERQNRLLEAIYHLPRPIIIYASKREDVYRWDDLLANAGFRRFAVMTGETPTTQRSQLIQQWRDKSIDIVVATSAFGLGVDQQDVRSVIHVCIPETIDRFYQEVGRGGRDGKASISLTLYTQNNNYQFQDDYKIAASLNEKRSITLDRGLQRWESMFNAKKRESEGLYRVNLDVPPSMSGKDIDMNSQQNRNWNSRTLILMSQAGLIEIDWRQPPQRQDYSSKEAYQKASENHQNSRIIRIKNEFHLKPETWDNYVEPIRKQRQRQNTRNLKLMKEALWERPNRCLSAIFQEAYTIPGKNEPNPRKNISVSLACGGCPWCRQQHKTPFASIMPHPSPIWKTCDYSLGNKLSKILKNENLLLIFYDSYQIKNLTNNNFYEVYHSQKIDNENLKDLQSKFKTNNFYNVTQGQDIDNKDLKGLPKTLEQLIQWLIRQGVKNLISPIPLNLSFSQNEIVFFYDEFQPIKMYPLPTVIYHPPNRTLPKKYLYANKFNVPHIILLPSNTKDPNRSDRFLINVFNGHSFSLDVFCKEINL
ncbi:protein DpdF [Crocosphaera sp. UHCC 0190]|uniref:protein DpdF n=1 Tax=unclassified Crocosphaera TaxID=2623705 RepID=UPI002B1F84EC|nr:MULTISPECIES: protein DpdF [unclassified Crocosphaera]MEA5511956.1 protein DpdF [Crocosphaera sp. UHCC 0190]MEA5536676.1 protein DpdF [Crocosphaera sp. XPORK-15E]